MKDFKDTVKKMIAEGEYSPNMNEVLNLIIEGKMNSLTLDDFLSQRDLSYDIIKEESLNVIIDYANICLADDVLTEEEMKNIGLLKLFFKVKPEDFSIYGRESDIRDILGFQLRRMYEDDVVDQDEAIMKTNLQSLFDLSYDDFLEIVNDIAKESLSRGADVKDLDTFIS